MSYFALALALSAFLFVPDGQTMPLTVAPQSSATVSRGAVTTQEIAGILDLASDRVADYRNTAGDGCVVTLALPLYNHLDQHYDQQGNVVAEIPRVVSDLTQEQLDTLNEFLRTQYCESPPSIHVVKEVSETISNTIVLQNDDALIYTLPADSFWAVDALILYESGALSGFRSAFSCPVGSVMSIGLQDALGAAQDCGGIRSTLGVGLGQIIPMRYTGVIETTQSGDVTFQWAQSTALLGNTTVMRGSYLKLTPLD